MDKCIIFLSKYEDYFKSAKKIKDNSNLKVNISYIEDFILKENNIDMLKNSIIYFLCNSELNKELVELLRNINCYIFNKRFFENNYTKLEMQNLLINSNINTPKVYQILNKNKMKLSILVKENRHAGMILEAYTKNTIKKFFGKFKEDDFYIEEKINGGQEIKYYFIINSIYTKNGDIVEDIVKTYCDKISNTLGLEIFSVDMIKKDSQYLVIDVNPSAGFYLLDEATTFRTMLFVTGDVLGAAIKPVSESEALEGTNFLSVLNTPVLTSEMTPVKWNGTNFST